MEQWLEIDTFPGYSISDRGGVRNDYTDRRLTPTRNQQGIYQVGMQRDGIHYKRSVTLLVARAFLPVSTFPAYDTPINLDGDRRNSRADNILWRPRWFAYKYHQQFKKFHRSRIYVDIIDLNTEEISEGSLACATTYGLLEDDLVLSIANRTYVWPTYQCFALVTLV